jgi:hypothetical protein
MIVESWSGVVSIVEGCFWPGLSIRAPPIHPRIHAAELFDVLLSKPARKAAKSALLLPKSAVLTRNPASRPARKP